jgi:PAS domain S-box-containing protein
MESFFDEMKRYVRFGEADGAALRAFRPHAALHYARIADEFYDRLADHDGARRVLSGPDQIARLKHTLREWFDSVLAGPWDEDYYERRARIGRVHVRIGLPQRYMLGAMDHIRIAFAEIAHGALEGDRDRRIAVISAVHKILDLELAIMLETYREAFVEQVQQLERVEKTALEHRLAISEARYEEIVETGEVLITTVDAEQRILLFNRRCEELTGLDRAAAQGRLWPAVFGAPGDLDRLAAAHAGALGGARVEPYEGPVPTGTGERRVRWQFTSLPSASGPIVCAMGIDVTDEQALAHRTRVAERLAALGTMAAGLAHEIRNPLNAAHLQLTLAQRRLDRRDATDLDGARGATALALTEMKRLAGLVEEFLQFARPQPPRPARGDLRATAAVVTALIGPDAERAGVDLVASDGPPVIADYDDEKMKQVIFNLLCNAVEAAGRGGRVRVRVAARDGGTVLEVEDDGPGLPSPDAPIFEPFFTTKPEGTGLGLAIVHRIVSDHGGHIDVDSRPGRTLFTVSLLQPR